MGIIRKNEKEIYKYPLLTQIGSVRKKTNFNPASYTHLDVYKRQPYRLAAMFDSLNGYEIQQIDKVVDFAFQSTPQCKAVSYTHLNNLFRGFFMPEYCFLRRR